MKSWKYEEIKNHFDSVKIPDEPIRLNVCTVINNPKKFVESHLNYLKDKDNKPTFYPYVQRLRKFAEIIKLQDGK